MTYLNKIKYMPLSNYSIDDDTEDTICAVDVSNLFGNAIFPEWSKAITLQFDTVYVVGSAALEYYRAGYFWLSGNRGSRRDAYINDVNFIGGYSNGDTGHESKLIFCPVSLGDTIKCTKNKKATATGMFIPITGGI